MVLGRLQVLVHDGVRPFIETKRISLLIKACKEYDAAVLAVQPKDTVRRSAGGSPVPEMCLADDYGKRVSRRASGPGSLELRLGGSTKVETKIKKEQDLLFKVK